VGEFDKFDGSDGLNLDEATGVNLKVGKNSAEAENQNLRESNLTDAAQTAGEKAPSGEQNLNSNGAKIEPSLMEYLKRVMTAGEIKEFYGTLRVFAAAQNIHRGE